LEVRAGGGVLIRVFASCVNVARTTLRFTTNKIEIIKP
jgi:hypothetical protein